jgi:phospholipid/cholesterol/gamma-HCH transport system ATP-binding protein
MMKQIQTNLVEIKDMSFGHDNGNLIFDHVDINILRGKITSIMGPSGTGKTTLLRLIAAQLAPTSGSVLVDGHQIHRLSRRELYDLRKRMGMLFQNSGLFTHLNVYENVAFPLREHTTLSESMIHTLVSIKTPNGGIAWCVSINAKRIIRGYGKTGCVGSRNCLGPRINYV